MQNQDENMCNFFLMQVLPIRIATSDQMASKKIIRTKTDRAENQTPDVDVYIGKVRAKRRDRSQTAGNASFYRRHLW